MPKIKRYFWNLLIAFDQFCNAFLGGSPDETISSRAGKRDDRADCAVCYWLCRFLHLIDPNHCARVLERDEGDRDVVR